MSRRAVVTGASGQDGSLLCELLVEQGYEVTGLVRRSPSERLENLDGVRGRARLLQVDLLDQFALAETLRETQPHEVYNLAAPSFVPLSWRQPVATAELAAVGGIALLEAVRAEAPGARVYQAVSSEIFGDPLSSPQDEETPVAPVTPYGAAKAYAFFVTRSYRRLHGLHASSGILYNHESPRRLPDFLPRKVALGAARIALGLDSELVVGDLDARRDWGYAADYVRAMWLMLQQDEPGDYVVATGVTHSVRDLVECAFAHAGLEWERHVRVDPTLVRGRAELHNLVGDASKARERLGWEPKVSFSELVRMLVDADLERLRERSHAL
ncbi:MAG: GDP-mannose 4,6-dehydratase [Thermoleophilia bacterium]|nr:GDP-mannose 4,6-dehydratase [Thermoleophilia bacterium]